VRQVSKARTLKESWAFRRPAVVLSGGGALGAYQVGVLKVLGEIGLRPAIVLGMSVGAINAVGWIANDFRVDVLRRTWGRVGPSSIGMRWTSLTLRLFGLFVTVLAGVEILLTAIGSDELSVARVFLRGATVGGEAHSVILDVLAWMIVGALGFGLARVARQAEDWLVRGKRLTDSRSLHRLLGIALALGLVAHLVTWGFGLSWPHRFSATVLVVGGAFWLINRPGATGDWVRHALVRLLPESGGRGLWRGLARRQLIESLVEAGDPQLLLDPRTHLIMNAVAVDTGRIGYFVNWADPSPAFRDRVDCALGDTILLRTPAEVIHAASASSALPVIFQPVRFHGHDYVDAGLFSSHAIDIALADGADALLVVIMSPAGGPELVGEDPHLLEVGTRLLDLGNWRDLRTELRSLPAPWSRERDPAKLCLVEPQSPLPGSLLALDPRNAARLMRHGEHDAWRALERAGWIETRATAAENPLADSREIPPVA
jgi:predicted acylesterase/phospholipase RssA